MAEPPVYIHDQVWNVLLDTTAPEKHLQPAAFRAMRARQTLSPKQWDNTWKTLDSHREVSEGRLADHDGNSIDCRRLVFTTDAGIGKTYALKWLHYRWNLPSGGKFAALFTFRELGSLTRDNFGDQLLDRMARQWNDRTNEQMGFDSAKRFLRIMRDRGDLVLLIDGLDQMTGQPDFLQWLVDSTTWNNLVIVLGGRPHALKRYWDDCFAGRAWRFIQVEPWDDEQQKRYLGPGPDGKPRIEKIPVDARGILTVPRVISYFRETVDSSRKPIRTPADVYQQAIDEMISKGMEASANARLIGWHEDTPPNKVQKLGIQTAWELLGMIAFETLIYWYRDDPPDTTLPSRPEDPPPEYNDAIEEGIFSEFCKRLQTRCEEAKTAGSLQRNLIGLDALNVNDLIQSGFFDVDSEGLDQILFSNRSLHEFLVAYFLAQHAEPADCEWLWDRIYIKDQPESDYYYFIWQFLCEMPEEKRNPQKWLQAIEPLYRGCVRLEKAHSEDEQVEYYAKRSTEMIFRSWSILNTYCEHKQAAVKRKANQVREMFLGEFGHILSGDQGDARQVDATECQDDLLEIPCGTFRMGTSLEKQGASEEQMASIRQLANRLRGNREAVQDYLNDWRFTRGPSGKRQRQLTVEMLLRGDAEEITELYYPKNETPFTDGEKDVPSFSLSRRTASNSWYRLFDPSHGMRKSEFSDAYPDYSSSPEHPAIFLSWYDSWAFTQWLHWNGKSCQLPTEVQWEYVAKLGVKDWTQRYWWSDEIDTGRCNVRETTIGATDVPNSRHANPATKKLDPKSIGVMDQLGNVWEWCQDVYRPRYQFREEDAPGPADASRILRGGSFDSDAVITRCSIRSSVAPADASHAVGVRVARASFTSFP